MSWEQVIPGLDFPPAFGKRNAVCWSTGGVRLSRPSIPLPKNLHRAQELHGQDRSVSSGYQAKGGQWKDECRHAGVAVGKSNEY